ncbi:MAG: hypothetical protein J4F48_02690 [Nitrospinae bacterium]|nr:hypothetical protein [Nitrospinota bacterium]
MKRLAFCLTMLVFLSGCGGFELTDSPFLRITRAQPKDSYLVAVQARLVPTDDHVISPLTPEEAEVREAACRGLSFTPRFRCVRMNEAGASLEKPDYVVQIEYDVVDLSSFLSRRFTRFVLVSGGDRDGEPDEGDDVGDANYEVRWGFRVLRTGDSKPVFQSIFREEGVDTWHFDVEQWMERYFSG